MVNKLVYVVNKSFIIFFFGVSSLNSVVKGLPFSWSKFSWLFKWWIAMTIVLLFYQKSSCRKNCHILAPYTSQLVWKVSLLQFWRGTTMLYIGVCILRIPLRQITKWICHFFWHNLDDNGSTVVNSIWCIQYFSIILILERNNICLLLIFGKKQWKGLAK